MQKISNFVDQLWIECEETEGDNDNDSQSLQLKRPKSSVNAPGLVDAQRRMEQAILETEKF